MDLPPHDALIDVDWLARTHAAERYDAPLRHVSNGAEIYGEPVAAVAEAVLDLRWGVGHRLADSIDLRHGLAHGLATGSWSRAPAGGRTLEACAQWLWPALSPNLRAAAATKYAPCEPPPIPDIERLQLIHPLDCAWVGHSGGIWGCDVSPDGRWMVSGSRDVAVWDMQSGTLVARGHPPAGARDWAVLSDGQRLISTDATGSVIV
jgi:hypothetical protein